jgi:hypothetical protein
MCKAWIQFRFHEGPEHAEIIKCDLTLDHTGNHQWHPFVTTDEAMIIWNQ